MDKWIQSEILFKYFYSKGIVNGENERLHAFVTRKGYFSEIRFSSFFFLHLLPNALFLRPFAKMRNRTFIMSCIEIIQFNIYLIVEQIKSNSWHFFFVEQYERREKKLFAE